MQVKLKENDKLLKGHTISKWREKEKKRKEKNKKHKSKKTQKNKKAINNNKRSLHNAMLFVVISTVSLLLYSVNILLEGSHSPSIQIIVHPFGYLLLLVSFFGVCGEYSSSLIFRYSSV